MNTKFKKIILLGLLLLGLISIVACKSDKETNSTPNPINITPSLSIPTMEFHPTLTLTPIFSKPTLQMTTLPTLNPEDAQIKISQLMETNDLCAGYCFWGIVPGTSSFSQSVSFLRTIIDQKYEIQNENLLSYNNSITNGTNNRIAIYFTEFEGLVNEMDIQVSGLENPDLLEQKWNAFRPDNFP